MWCSGASLWPLSLLLAAIWISTAVVVCLSESAVIIMPLYAFLGTIVLVTAWPKRDYVELRDDGRV
jgi:hypothetical protein